MKKFYAFSAILLGAFMLIGLTLSTSAVAAEIVEASIATEVVDLTPVDADDSFSSDVGNLKAFIKITGANGTTITHKWYHGEKLMAAVALNIGSDSWRTYSSKNILESWTGDWHVDITDEDGTILKTLDFEVE
ncbi:MAG: DUF2914 domain-containing protein [Deltaproteobacteria bacterium]|nr:DUF2914 domain-containing protein [Deltaproteobacteria bacterium]